MAENETKPNPPILTRFQYLICNRRFVDLTTAPGNQGELPSGRMYQVDVAEILTRVRWNDAGLVPVVVQEYTSNAVLMLAWMNAEALSHALTTRQGTYWSRRRNELWIKGLTSGHTQHIREIRLDCDGDTVLLKVDQVGPACHTNTRTCFDSDCVLADNERVGTVLDELVAGARADMTLRLAEVSLTQIYAAAESSAPALDPMPRFRRPGLAVIAEVKRASPSKGALATIPDPAWLATEYAAAGAAAISVLTEERRFGGSLEDLAQVRAAVQIPVLRKDFITSEYQLVEARAYGADLALLIVAALTQSELVSLFETGRELGLTLLVETHSEAEVLRALDVGAELIGVNNRDLNTLEVDLHQFEKLAKLIPDTAVKVAESGILNLADARRMYDCGADVVLAGEIFVKADDPRGCVGKMSAITAGE